LSSNKFAHELQEEIVVKKARSKVENTIDQTENTLLISVMNSAKLSWKNLQYWDVCRKL
jgi:hypothetical protein